MFDHGFQPMISKASWQQRAIFHHSKRLPFAKSCRSGTNDLRAATRWFPACQLWINVRLEADVTSTGKQEEHSVYRVKHVDSDDVRHLVRVWRATWPFTYADTLGTTAVEAMLRELDENGTANMIPEGAQGLCLMHDEEIVGTAIHSKEGAQVYLWGMYVMPGYQRSGAGSLLLGAVRDAAGERPIEVRVLQSSAHANSFYQKYGFQTIGEERIEIMPGVEGACRVMRQTA